MADFHVDLIAVWATAIASLTLQIYLLATWPKTTTSSISLSSTAGVEPPSSTAEWQNLSPVTGGSPFETMPDFATPPPDATDLLGQPPTLSRGTKANQPATLRDRIVRAGIYQKRGMYLFHLSRLLLSAALFALGFLVANWLTHITELTLLAAALAGLAGYIAPSFWLDHRLRVRQTNVRRALPDALDLINVCMQGGLSLTASLARVSRELQLAHPLLASELSIVEREIQMGRATGEAMRHFAHRFNLEELRSLASVVWQTEKFGGSIVGALTTYAKSMRVKRRQRAEEMAQKAAVKILFPTLLCIFPGIFVVILGPTAIRVYQVLIVGHPWGN